MITAYMYTITHYAKSAKMSGSSAKTGQLHCYTQRKYYTNLHEEERNPTNLQDGHTHALTLGAIYKAETVLDYLIGIN